MYVQFTINNPSVKCTLCYVAGLANPNGKLKYKYENKSYSVISSYQYQKYSHVVPWLCPSTIYVIKYFQPFNSITDDKM